MDFNGTLFDIEPEPVAVVGHAWGVDRSWCQPSRHAEIVGLDFGRQGMCAYFSSTGKAVRIPPGGEMKFLLSLSPGTLAVCEWAHLAVEQTERSLAQYFTADQLIELYVGLKARGVTLCLFPHYHSGPRARAWSAHHYPDVVESEKSDDVNDAAALALYVKFCNGISLAKPPESFARCEKRDYGRAVIDFANRVLNAERSFGYKGHKFPHVVALGRKINAKKCGTFIDHDRAVSIAALIVTEVGGQKLMFTRGGRPPGARFWMRYVLRFTPFHHRGGIARSNIMKHRFPAYFMAVAARRGVSAKTDGTRDQFATFTAEQEAARLYATNRMRAAVLEGYRIGVAEAHKMGFEPYEITAGDRKAVSRGR
jgi:hypothetical protein